MKNTVIIVYVSSIYLYKNNILQYNIYYKKSFILSFDHNAKTVGRDVIDAVQKCAFTWDNSEGKHI